MEESSSESVHSSWPSIITAYHGGANYYAFWFLGFVVFTLCCWRVERAWSLVFTDQRAY